MSNRKAPAGGAVSKEAKRGKEPVIHSIAALQRDRRFAGRFEASGAVYEFEYIPAKAEVVNGKLNLLGDLSVVGPQKKKQVRKNVRLALQSTQGGLGGSPTPRMAVPASTEAAATRLKQLGTSVPSDRPLLVTDSTGPLGFVGVMYLRFEPLAGAQLGVPADLSRLQLNARLYAANGTEETLQYLYSHITDALYGPSPDPAAANIFVKDLNSVLSRES
jgi:hypothetical protein